MVSETKILVGEGGGELIVQPQIFVVGTPEPIAGCLDISSITIAGHVYTAADWEPDRVPNTLAAIARDIADVLGWWGFSEQDLGRAADEAVGLLALPSPAPPTRELQPFPARALRDGPGTAAPLLF